MKAIRIFVISLVLAVALGNSAVYASINTIPDPPTPANQSKSTSFARKAYGIVDVLYNTGSSKKIKLIIEHAGQRYIYNLKSEERYVTFPLQLGNGSYALNIYENTSGTKYKKVYSTNGYVALEDQNIVFLNSIQQIEWTNDDQTVAFAAQLLDDYMLSTYGIPQGDGTIAVPEGKEATSREIIDLYYNWIVTNVVYDYNKIETLNYDYIPDVDMILEAKSGICYDYSVLFSAMLRSQNIPSQLIKGYTSWTSVYHAWNEIYLEETDEWVVVDTTYDSYLYLSNRNYDFEKSRDVYATSYYY